MPGLLNITDADFSTASRSIADMIADPAGRVEKVLRQYVDLGVTKKIADYPSSTLTAQNNVAAAVQNAVSGIFDRYELTEVRNVLNELAIEAINGVLDQRIAYPLRWQTQQEQAQVTSHDTSAGGAADTSFGKNLSDVLNSVFSGAGNAVNSFAAGLGISPTILVLALVLIIALPLLRLLPS